MAAPKAPRRKTVVLTFATGGPTESGACHLRSRPARVTMMPLRAAVDMVTQEELRKNRVIWEMAEEILDAATALDDLAVERIRAGAAVEAGDERPLLGVAIGLEIEAENATSEGLTTHLVRQRKREALDGLSDSLMWALATVMAYEKDVRIEQTS